MKTYVYLLLVLVVGLSTSCNVDNEDPVVRTEFMPIINVAVPDHFVQGETYEVLMSYLKPSSCYVFNNIIFDIEGHERTVSILNTVYQNDNCTIQDELTTVSFDLTVSGDEIYLFKFYQGKDEFGIDQYHLVEVPVVSNRASKTVNKK
ncbi:hypothetical protein BWZ20_09560 [Winogradskyella sp. J14-2]|uniref:hypothetical protein n=1 Tax=Winogradskyella sp. J14-2 TaxID=1936080 RepID=UPI0009726D02|nr:hypothetical protein [Winogradskyella sp. J14-2]APY08531.1 hypothetical protein BWZ20_09560 [Winogradskyella sp. J14-2]